MRNPSPTPLQVTTKDLGLSDLGHSIAADQIAFRQIEHIAAERCGREALLTQALDTCGLLHASDVSRREEGYLPEDTIDEAVAKGADVHRQRGHAALLLARRGGEIAR